MARIGVLGPVTVAGADGTLAPREQVVLAALTVYRGEVVSAETLADAWWGERVPPTWTKALQGCVVRLRKALGPHAIETRPQGYCLVMPADEVDAGRFERHVARAQELLTLGEPDRAAYVVDEALGLWRGRALVELDGWEPGRVAAARLEGLRLDAEELRLDAMVRAGRFREVLAEAQVRVAAEPLREHRWRLLALAQYQAGRQGDALRTLHRARRVLAEELGLDPGPDLVALEEAILRQDPSLIAEQLPEPSPVCPYLGLVPYDIDDADGFFGRDADVSECLGRLADAGVLAVVGPSGSGKSSLVRAGIAAALQRDGRRVVVVTPGARPTDALPAAADSHRASVLVVDQCEEVVTLCTDADEREAFFAALVDHAERTPLVVALRADRLGELSAHPGFARVVERGLFLLQAMGEDDLRAAIEGPARQAGLRLEPGLVDLLVRDVEGEPGALPLLSHALRQTWQRREGRTLTVAGYRASGGIRGAVAQSAEQLYEQAPPDQRPVMRDLLLRLVAPSPDGEPVRSRVPRRMVATDAQHERIIEQLVSARLVTSDEDVVELAHEALARAWPRLRGWLDDDVEGQRIWRHLTAAADSWEAMGRPDSELYRGVRLDQAVEWRDRARPDLNTIERTFLDASHTERDRQRQREAEQLKRTARANRRLRAQLVALGIALVIALVVGVVAVRQRDTATRERRVATARELAAAANANLDVDPERSVLLALAAVDRSRSGAGGVLPEAEQALHDAVTASRAVLHVPGVGGAVAWSPDGTRFAAADPDGAVVIHDAATGEAVQAIAGHDEPVNGIAFSPDGALLGTTGEDGFVKLWDLETGNELHALKSPAGRDALAPSFSPDGTLFAASWWNEELVPILDLASGRVVREIADFPSCCPRSTAFDPSGTRMALALADNTAVVVDVRSGQQVLDLGVTGAWDAAWSPDGRSIAVESDGSARIFDARTGQERFALVGHRGRVNDLDWSPDSTRVVTASEDGTAKVWTTTGGVARELFTLSAQATRAGVASAVFSPDGSRVLTGDVEGRATIVWDASIAGDAELANVPAAAFAQGTAAFTPDGRYLLVGNAAGGVSVWDTETFSGVRTLGARAASSPGPPEGGDVIDPPATAGVEVTALDASPDGRLVAAAISDWTVCCPNGSSLRIWNVETGQAAFRVRPRGNVDDVAWSPDSKLLAISAQSFTVDADGNITSVKGSLAVVDRSGGEVAYLPDEEQGVQLLSIAFTPDGERLIASRSHGASWEGYVGEVVVWDWKAGEVEHRIETGDDFAVLSPRADLLVSTPRSFLTGSQVANVWDWATGQHLRSLSHSGSVTYAAFSPDGSRLATASRDGTIRVWDPYADAPEQLALRGHAGPVGMAAFSPDGSRLASVSEDGIVRVWALDLDELVDVAERGLTRTLTDDECRQYLHADKCH
ncbi:MAG TPA: BTAD domain-containing putative transcriptional regulator [Acidimicrobiales bacterium]|nr:BTAD domain-containing putative transcriptional regulator [Acidimicrobiales bacterium]